MNRIKAGNRVYVKTSVVLTSSNPPDLFDPDGAVKVEFILPNKSVGEQATLSRITEGVYGGTYRIPTNAMKGFWKYRILVTHQSLIDVSIEEDAFEVV